MKDILIVVKQRQDSCAEPYNKLRMEALKYKELAPEILGTAFLLKAPKSFEIAMSLSRIASEESFQFAFFEIEQVLFDPNSKT